MPSSKNDHYYPTYKRPPKANASIVTSISSAIPLISCLDNALEEIIADQVLEEEEDDKSSDTSPSAKQSGECKICVDADFKKLIMSKCTESLMNSFWRKSSLEAKELKSPHTNNRREGKGTCKSCNQICEPPAALIKGRMKFYNRFGGQWRILVENAEIRPRVDVNYPSLKRKEIVSLTQQSRQHTEMELRNKRRRMTDGTYGNVSPQLQDDGSVKLDEDLLILAYDDGPF